VTAYKPDIDMTRQFDRAEAILAKSGMHPVMARAVIEFARYGERHGACGPAVRNDHGSTESDDLLTTRQAATRIGVSDKQIYRLVQQGRLRSHVFGRLHRFATADLDALIRASSTSARTARMARLADDEQRTA
jgi:excisionase family DNA binding protein